MYWRITGSTEQLSAAAFPEPPTFFTPHALVRLFEIVILGISPDAQNGIEIAPHGVSRPPEPSGRARSGFEQALESRSAAQRRADERDRVLKKARMVLRNEAGLAARSRGVHVSLPGTFSAHGALVDVSSRACKPSARNARMRVSPAPSPLRARQQRIKCQGRSAPRKKNNDARCTTEAGRSVQFSSFLSAEAGPA